MKPPSEIRVDISIINDFVKDKCNVCLSSVNVAGTRKDLLKQLLYGCMLQDTEIFLLPYHTGLLSFDFFPEYIVFV